MNIDKLLTEAREKALALYKHCHWEVTPEQIARDRLQAQAEALEAAAKHYEELECRTIAWAIRECAAPYREAAGKCA